MDGFHLRAIAIQDALQILDIAWGQFTECIDENFKQTKSHF